MEEEGSRIWKARNTVVEMVKDRGYITSQTVMTYSEFKSKYPMAESSPSLLNFVASKETTDPQTASPFTSSLAVCFSFDEKIQKAFIERTINEYTSQSVQTLLLVTPNKFNPSVKAAIKAAPIHIESFLIEELQLNVTKHFLVPPHRIMLPEEREALLKRLRTTADKLPVILSTDPLARYYGGKVGDIFEIRRKSLTAGVALYYRVLKEKI